MYVDVGENRPFLEKLPLAFVCPIRDLTELDVSTYNNYYRKSMKLKQNHSSPLLEMMKQLLPQHSLEWRTNISLPSETG